MSWNAVEQWGQEKGKGNIHGQEAGCGTTPSSDLLGQRYNHRIETRADLPLSQECDRHQAFEEI
jgi:hypothetical protein